MSPRAFFPLGLIGEVIFAYASGYENSRLSEPNEV
jgi:hypothetical protein